MIASQAFDDSVLVEVPHLDGSVQIFASSSKKKGRTVFTVRP